MTPHNSRSAGRRLIRHRIAAWTAVIMLALAGVLRAPAAAAAPTTPARIPATAYDVNGDGYADLVAGMPYRTVNQHEYAGAISILLGSANGLTTTHSQYLTQASAGIKGRAAGWAFFGQTVISADFDRDGYADIATRASGTDVLVIYGGRNGLTRRDQLMHLARYNIGWLSISAHLLRTGDFDRDGYADLVVADQGYEDEYGRLVIFRGSPHGLLTDAGLYIDRDTPGVPGNRYVEDDFAGSVATGDVTGDGYDDLVVTSAEETGSGTTYLFRGSPKGITTPGVSTSSPALGALGIADLNGDGYGDLIVPTALEPCPDECAGAISIISGSPAGIRPQNRDIWSEDSPGVPGHADPGDGFGSTVAVGDLNGDTHLDLAISAPFKRVGKINEAGAVIILYGTDHGLTGAGSQMWTQASPQIKGTPRTEDHLGSGGLHILDFGKGIQADLAIHSPGDVPRGAVNVLYGSPSGVTVSDQFWHAYRHGIAGRTIQRGIGFGGDCC